jgi:Phosphodiester glycosidase
MPLALVEPIRPPRPGRARRVRLELADGLRTTVHIASHDAACTEIRVAVLRGQARLEPWCAARGVEEAIVGGFFVRAGGSGLPLGEVRTRGVARRHVPFDAPWDGARACVHVQGGRARIAPRHALPAAPRGDLLQAGPLLVRDGRPVFRRERDAEGFSAGRRQFDSDITDGRHPRAALGLAADRYYAVACDGRSRHDAGLTLEELAALMAALGCESALNLDGGGSTSLISGGRLRNRPRKAFDEPEPGGRPVSTALLFL